MEKFRNLTYLEQQLEEYNKLERDRMEVSSTRRNGSGGVEEFEGFWRTGVLVTVCNVVVAVYLLQETESSLKQMQMRMQEEDRRLYHDDVLQDGILSTEDAFPKARGVSTIVSVA